MITGCSGAKFPHVSCSGGQGRECLRLLPVQCFTVLTKVAAATTITVEIKKLNVVIHKSPATDAQTCSSKKTVLAAMELELSASSQSFGEKQAGALAGLCTEAGEGNDANRSEQK